MLILGVNIADAGIEGGAEAKASTTVHPNLTCIDIGAWLYAEVYAELLEGTELKWSKDGEINLKASKTLLDEDNSFFKWTLHWENGSLVSECTWDEGQGESNPPDDEDSLEADNGYGNVPIFKDTGGYGNRLKEPFNVYAGQSIMIGELGASTTIGSSWWFINYVCGSQLADLRFTYFNSDGSSSETQGFDVGGGSTGLRCMGEPIIIEVLRGRVTITKVYAYYNPPCLIY